MGQEVRMQEEFISKGLSICSYNLLCLSDLFELKSLTYHSLFLFWGNRPPCVAQFGLEFHSSVSYSAS